MSDTRIHSRFGGSNTARWLRCAGSVKLNAELPAFRSEYADRGSAMHAVVEECLYRKEHPQAFLGKPVTGYPHITVDQNMVDDLAIYLQIIEAEVALSDTAEVFIEARVDLDIPGCAPGEVGGTPDLYVWHPEHGRLRNFDFKGGFQEVVVEENDQHKFYLAGILYQHPGWKVKELIATVVQPGGLNDQDVRDWTFDRIELLEFLGDVEAAIAKAKAFMRDGHGQDAFVAGPWCASTYCTAFAAGTCPAVAAGVMKGFGMDFGPMAPVAIEDVTVDALPDPKHLDLTQLAKIIDGQDALMTWAVRCRQYLEAMLLAGAQAPGWKVVDKIGRAKWIDDPKQIVAYAEMMFGVPPDLMWRAPETITITDAEKRLKAAGASKDAIDSFKLKFTIKDSSGVTIARASDRRPAVDAVAANFAGVNVIAAE